MENIDHHDHENEIEHLHQHSHKFNNNLEQTSSTIIQSAKNIINTNTTYDSIISNIINTNHSNEKDIENILFLTNSTNTLANWYQFTNRNNNPATNIEDNRLLDEQSVCLITNNNNCVCEESMLNSENNSESDSKSLNKINELKNSNQKRSNSMLIATTGHSHGHSHSHKYKSSREKAHHDHHRKHEKEISDIKLIAWMVLMGDGLHNFSDGLAIGASFASSLTTGFGTAIAVLCHELPHEIGDFAVLRRAGVSLKRALVFNAVSGVLCMLGTLVGLLIGGFPALTNWIFLFIAGTFLYISLVDMVGRFNKDLYCFTNQNKIFYIERYLSCPKIKKTTA